MTTLVLVRKLRTTESTWEYIFDDTSYTCASSGNLLDQLFDVVEEIVDRIPDGEQAVIVSPVFGNTGVYQIIQDLFPEVAFIKFDGSTMKVEFMRRFTDDIDRHRTGTRTLFVGTDGSGGHNGSLAAWAWVSAGKTGSYGMGLCQFQNSNTSEFEGILRAVVENADTDYDRIHLYSDSKNAIEYFENSVYGGDDLEMVEGTYLADLVVKCREVVKSKPTTISWIRGHRNHRLIRAADVISRHARVSAESGKNLRQLTLEADAMFSIFNKHYTK